MEIEKESSHLLVYTVVYRMTHTESKGKLGSKKSRSCTWVAVTQAFRKSPLSPAGRKEVGISKQNKLSNPGSQILDTYALATTTNSCT